MQNSEMKSAETDTNKNKAKTAPDDSEEVKEHKSKMTEIVMGSLATFLIIYTFFFILPLTKSGVKYVAKQEIKAFVVKAIEKGADLRAIKHAYDNRNLKFKSLREIFNDMNGFYAETVPLSIILEDIRTDKYVFDDASGPDTQLIDSIIEEHLAVNPFDALEDAQKDYFENIRLKLADNYSLVRLEVDKLASELHNKNSLVNKYLKDSTKSFWISITALAFSLLIGILQLFLHRAERTKAIVASTIRSDRGKR